MNHYLPNILTSFRLISGPIFYFLYFADFGVIKILSEVLFLFAALSDYLDGKLARKYNSNTKFGAFFDPLADKILIGIAFYAFSMEDHISGWMVIIVVFRDVVTTGLRKYLLFKGTELQTSKSAKLKTFSQFLFIAYIMFANFFIITGLFSISSESAEILKSDFTYYFMLVICLITMGTLIEYIFKNRSLIWD